MNNVARKRNSQSVTSEAFVSRYHAVIEAAARFVHSRASKGVPFTTLDVVSEWIAHDLPTLYRQTFGGGTPKPLRAWRVRRMLQDANYLGAFAELDVKAVRGKGFSPVAKPRKRSTLRLVVGGKH